MLANLMFKSALTTHPHTTEQASPLPENIPQLERVQAYYAEASEGYRDWSKGLNMHFGTYTWGTNPFNLEAMLENTNRAVLQSLKLRGQQNYVLDMGCGLGATARFAAGQTAVASVTGITIAENQVKEARALSCDRPGAHKLGFHRADYHHTPFESAQFDGIYAIESACHNTEQNKTSLLQEALRLLKPGATLALCDGFMTTQTHSAFTRLCYQKTCHHWALGHFPDLHQVTAHMAELGFVNIKVIDLSWRVLPSALFVPWMIIKYGVKLLCRGDRNPQHWHHLLAPLWGLGLAMNRKAFGYYLVTGDKPDVTTLATQDVNP